MNPVSETLERLTPRILALGGRVLPAPALALGGAVLANILLGPDTSLVPLSGSRICLELTAPAIKLGFVVKGRRLWPAPPLPWDVCIRGDWRAFLTLLTQSEDADALFFDRRLAVEGRTEIALPLRHALDAAIYRQKKRLQSLLPGGHQ